MIIGEGSRATANISSRKRKAGSFLPRVGLRVYVIGLALTFGNLSLKHELKRANLVALPKMMLYNIISIIFIIIISQGSIFSNKSYV